MNIEIAFTGKAGKIGHESWGLPDEPNFSNHVYPRSKREDVSSSRLEVEIRELGGVVYTYYTFMKAKNVAEIQKEDGLSIDPHGRSGSFFAITLRVENSYIPDIFTLYAIFEKVFNQNVKDFIFEDVEIDGNLILTYKINNFAEGGDVFEKAETILKDEVLSLMITGLPTIFSTKKGKDVKTFGLDESDLETINNFLFNDSEVIISRDYKQKQVVEPPIQQPSATSADSHIEIEKEDEKVTTSLDINEKFKEAEINDLQSQIAELKSINANFTQRECEHLQLIDELTNKQQNRPFLDLYKSIIAIAACFVLLFGMYKLIAPSPKEVVQSDNLLKEVVSKINEDDEFKKGLLTMVDSIVKADSKTNADSKAKAQTNIEKKWKVKASSVRIREKPNGTQIGSIPQNEIFYAVADSLDGWQKIYKNNKNDYFTQGTVGYVTTNPEFVQQEE